MKFLYASASIIPSRRANSVHVMKMCAALAKQLPEDSLILTAKKGNEQNRLSPFAYYGIQGVFDLQLNCEIGDSIILLFINKLKSIYKILNQRVDIVYGRDVWQVVFGSMRIGIEVHQPPAGVEKWLFKCLLMRKESPLFVSISKALEAELLRQYPALKNKPRLVLADGADPVLEQVVPRALKGVFKVGYTGSLLPGKGAERLLELARVMPDIHFHLCGGAQGEIADLCKGGVPDNLICHGHIAPSDLPAYVKAFDVVLAPYGTKVSIRTGAEIGRWMSPLKLFEYMAAGKAMVVSDLPVLREVLSDHYNALLVPPDDLAGWQQAIETLRQDQALRDQLARQAKADFEAEFSWDKRAKKLLDAITNL